MIQNLASIGHFSSDGAASTAVKGLKCLKRRRRVERGSTTKKNSTFHVCDLIQAIQPAALKQLRTVRELCITHNLIQRHVLACLNTKNTERWYTYISLVLQFKNSPQSWAIVHSVVVSWFRFGSLWSSLFPALALVAYEVVCLNEWMKIYIQRIKKFHTKLFRFCLTLPLRFCIKLDRSDFSWSIFIMYS